MYYVVSNPECHNPLGVACWKRVAKNKWQALNKYGENIDTSPTNDEMILGWVDQNDTVIQKTYNFKKQNFPRLFKEGELIVKYDNNLSGMVCELVTGSYRPTAYCIESWHDRSKHGKELFGIQREVYLKLFN